MTENMFAMRLLLLLLLLVHRDIELQKAFQTKEGRYNPALFCLRCLHVC